MPLTTRWRAGAVPADQRHPADGGLSREGVIQDRDPLGVRSELPLGLVPEGLGSGRQLGQRAVGGVRGGPAGRRLRDVARRGTTEPAWGGAQEREVVFWAALALAQIPIVRTTPPRRAVPSRAGVRNS
jgi:hypothetical protein